MNFPDPTLCIADDSTFWPWLRWPQFAEWKDPADTVVVVPVAGMSDWGLGGPFDSEELVLMHVLRVASLSRPKDLSLLVAPPIRFVLGPEPECAFPVDPPTAHRLIEEVVSSIASAGFRRIVLFNASPWNEELCDAAARDLRIGRGLQMFCINLSAIDLDFFPGRSDSRQQLRSLINALSDSVSTEHATLSEAGARLVVLLTEIKQRSALDQNGVIPKASIP